MATYLHPIATVVPDTFYSQTFAGDIMKLQVSDRKLERLVHRIYTQSGIEKRHSVVSQSDSETLFFDFETQKLKSPSTQVRNDIYIKEAKKLYVCAAKQALQQSGYEAQDVTHVITVSCTGFFAPGPEYVIVKELCLKPSTQRYHVGFMGCYATFPALKMAQAFCEADKNAVVLVVSLELCSLHLKPSDDVDIIIANSVFADGGAGVVMSTKPTQNALRVDAFATTLTPNGEEDMAWTIGDEGFDIVLSTYVPEILETNIAAAVQPLFTSVGVEKQDVMHWAIHPGGRAILDKVQRGLELGEEHLEVSRAVLRDYGNMSSVTILFVLKEMMAKAKPNDSIYAMAFGPGLTVESGLFSKI